MRAILFPYKQKFNFLLRKVLAVLVLSSVAVGGALANDIDWKSPLGRCWQTETGELLKSQIASDNDSIFVLKAPDSVLALSQSDGQIRWESDLLGNLGGQVRILGSRLWIASYFGDQDTGEQSIFRIVEASTGVPFPANNKALGADVEIHGEADSPILMERETGVLVGLDSSGAIRWKRELGIQVTAFAFQEKKVVVGTKGNSLVVLSGADGSILSQRNTGGVPQSIVALDDDSFAVGDVRGNLRALGGDLEPIWKTKMGGGISSLEIYGDMIVAASNDNFVYGVDAKSGRKIWKRKLAGRIIGSDRLSSGIAVYLTTGSDTAVLLDLASGALVNKFATGDTFSGPPVALKTGIVLPLENSILKISDERCEKK
ncbi:MAG: PQQ-binding-like beta-propeller repeat protein [Pyrinomonadaceae bacterium]